MATNSSNIDVKELRKKARSIQAIVLIGKNGITDTVILEIAKIIKIRKLIKVKLLQSFSSEEDRYQAASLLAEKTDALLVQVVGNNIVLYKR